MKKRGKILRDASAGPGLVSVDGQHYQFSLAGLWKGDAPPTAGMTVQVEFAPDGNMSCIIPVSESQIAKEQAEALAKVAGEKGKAIAGAAVAKFGVPTLVATGLLIIGWFFLTSISIHSPIGRIDLTLWQILGLLNSGNAFETAMEGRNSAGAGLYGLLAFLALAGPYVSYFWKDKRASLAGILPLAFLAVAEVMFRGSISSSMGGYVTGPLGEVARQAREDAMKALSFGFGTYLSAVVGIYFAGAGAKKFLLSHALTTEMPERSKPAAA